MHKFACTSIALFACALAVPPAVAAVSTTSCGRLSTGDTFNDLNKILDCIEAKASGQPVTATSDDTGYVEEQEPNDRIDDANPIALGTTLRGRIRKNNEFDIFRFTAPATDGVVRIILRQTQTNGFYPSVKLYNDLEVQVGGIEGFANRTISLPVKTEANRGYYISVTCRSDCTQANNDYELVVIPE